MPHEIWLAHAPSPAWMMQEPDAMMEHAPPAHHVIDSDDELQATDSMPGQVKDAIVVKFMRQSYVPATPL